MYNNSIWKYNGHGYPHIYFPQYIYFKKCVFFFKKHLDEKREHQYHNVLIYTIKLEAGENQLFVSKNNSV